MTTLVGVVATVAALVLAVPLAGGAQEVTLEVARAFPERSIHVKRPEARIAPLDDEDQGTMRLDFAGATVIPAFEVGNAVRTGVVDLAMSTGAVYTNVLPEPDALELTRIPIAEQRRNGACDDIAGRPVSGP